MCGTFACNAPLPAPTKNGPGPEYEDPSSEAAPLNPKFDEEATALFETTGGQALKTCHTEAQAAGAFEGSVQIHVVLRPNGEVVAVEPRNDTGLPAAMVTCMMQAVRGLKFPAPGGERNISFELPLRFDAPAPAEEPLDAGPAPDAATKPAGKKAR